MKIIRWGILGPGKIACSFAAGLREAKGAKLVAIGSRDLNRARDFAREYGATSAYGSYEELAADANVDAVYIGTPHSHHEAHSVLCLQAGKHVLCEKPLALSASQVERMIAAARENSVVLMEGMWTRFLPALNFVREQIAAGAIGEVRMIGADFGFRTDVDPESRLFNPDLGGGALLDLGVYPVSLAHMLCGAPVDIHSTANIGSTGVDEESAILLRHAGGQIAVLTCALRLNTAREANIYGTQGRITIGFPWWSATSVRLHKENCEEQLHEFSNRGLGYTYEAEAFMNIIRSEQMESKIIPLDESLAIMRTMDTIRAQWGLIYPGQTSGSKSGTDNIVFD